MNKRIFSVLITVLVAVTMLVPAGITASAARVVPFTSSLDYSKAEITLVS